EASRRQELPAMEAQAVVVGGRKGRPRLTARRRCGELGGLHPAPPSLRKSQWGTAAGPGLSGVIFGTKATSLLMSPDFLGPTSACSRTSLSVSTGTLSIFPW